MQEDEMRDEREQQAQDPGTEHDEPTTDGPAEEDEEFTSAQTRAGSNLPNAAGHRGDGTHE
jgi:hypothetical protein